MMSIGWIKLHRKLQDNPIWTFEPFTRGQAWVDLILLANHKDGYIYVRGNKVVIKRGQVGWSIVKISQRWQWSKGKVKRFLNDLEDEQQIEQQKNNVTSIITIVNYKEYQKNEQQTEPQIDPQTDHRQNRRRVTNKNDKNGKNEKESIYDFEKFWNDYQKKTGLSKAKAKYQKIGENDRAIIREHVPRYVASTPDPKYRKDPTTYLNGEHWHDEIISGNHKPVNIDDLIDHRIY